MKRNTMQREAIRHVLATAGRPLLAQEVLETAQRSIAGLGIATVYRSLKDLQATADIRAVRLPGEADRYEPANRPHHHHFQCMACRRVYDIQGCPGDLDRLAPRHFHVQYHDVTLYGRCAECGTTPRRAARGTS